MNSITSASEHLKYAFQKNPLYLVLFIGMGILALFGFLVLVLLGWSNVGLAPFDDEVAMLEEQQDDELGENFEEPAIPAPGVAYGEIVTVQGSQITLEVAVEEGTTEQFQFTLTADTTYAHFTYASDDDLQGTETPITHSDLKAGDTVAVYVAGEILRDAPNVTIRVVKTSE